MAVFKTKINGEYYDNNLQIMFERFLYWNGTGCVCVAGKYGRKVEGGRDTSYKNEGKACHVVILSCRYDIY